MAYDVEEWAEERQLVSVRYVPYAVARSLLAARIQEGEDVSDVIRRTWEYLREFGQGDEDLAEEAVKRLVEMGVDEKAAVNIVSICPSSRGEVRSILQVSGQVTYEPETLDAILEAIRDFCRTASR